VAFYRADVKAGGEGRWGLKVAGGRLKVEGLIQFVWWQVSGAAANDE
jgi:hypothetical protein